MSAADADESPGRLGLHAADARLMAWHAAMSLTRVEFEALDLACRHYVDLALVLGLPAGEAAALLDRARQNLDAGARRPDPGQPRPCLPGPRLGCWPGCWPGLADLGWLTGRD